jgi:hypothetical protein
VILVEAGMGETQITAEGREVLDYDPVYLGYWGRADLMD